MSFVGEEIKHSKYGVGKVLCFEKREKDFLVKIQFANEEKSLIANLMSFKSFVFLNEDKHQGFLQCIDSLIPPPLPPKDYLKVSEDRINALLKGNIIGRDVSFERGSLAISKGFKFKQTYGGKALTIYENGIEYLDFDIKKRSFFDLRRLLYAQNCTKEGYSVWMLPYSVLNGKTNGSWANFIDLTKNEIIQYTFVSDYFIHPVGEKRLTFVKQKSGEYVFLGVYELKEKRYVNFEGNNIKEETYCLWQEDYLKN